jgi:hypothetical protein
MANTRSPVRRRPAQKAFPHPVPASRRACGGHYLGAALVIVLAASVTGGALIVNSSNDSAARQAASGEPAGATGAGRAWRDAALGDFMAMNGVLVDFARTLEDWRSGRGSDAATAAQLDRALPAFVATRTALAAREPFAAAPRALDDYRQAVALYLESARLAKVGTGLGKGPLPDRLRVTFARLRTLGDRIFDQAAVELGVTGPPAMDGVVVTRPAEVPDWPSLGLDSGPPLGDAVSTATPRVYQDRRPQQPFADWAEEVTRAHIPGAAEETAAITGGSAETLRAMSEQLTAASAKLYSTADPDGERAASTRVQLGLLVHAEAARAAEAATLTSGADAGELRTVAQTLALIGDRLWDDRLGARSTGFPATLLTRPATGG